MHGTYQDTQDEVTSGSYAPVFSIEYIKSPFSKNLLPYLVYNPDKLTQTHSVSGHSVSHHGTCRLLDLSGLDQRHVDILASMLKEPYKAAPDFAMRRAGLDASNVGSMLVSLTIKCRNNQFPMPGTEKDQYGTYYIPLKTPAAPKPSKPWPIWNPNLPKI